MACMAPLAAQGQAASSPDSLWEDAAPPTIARRGLAAPESYYRLLRVDITALERTLGQAPFEERPGAEIILSIPMPSGGFQRFLIEESPIMAPALTAKFPDIKTYRGISLDDPQGTARFDLTPKGFHAIFHSSKGTVYIDPDSPTQDGLPELYRSYFKRDFKPAQPKKRECQVDETESPAEILGFRPSPLALRPSGNTLRTYRIAIAASGEYTCFVTTGDSQACAGGATGTKNDALAAIVTTLNRVDFIYEREVAVRFELVEDNDLIIYTNRDTDPYTNDDGHTMLGENQMNLDNIIGNDNYDIGHVFSTGGGGAAVPATVCQAGSKAKGVTGSSRPLGDPFDVDFVAHEMGHQFSAQHTFNGTAGACGGKNARKPNDAYEPGSGSTIMSYAGICGEQNLQPHADPYFHGLSFDQIVDYTTQSTGNSCPLITSTLNQAPVGVDAGPSYTLPMGTPFTLTGTAIDPDDDPLTYNWEEFDLEKDGNSPLFRSFPPTDDPSRTFPQLSDLLNNTSTLGEQLPAEARELTFRLTARDNRAGGGGVDYDMVTLEVTDLAGPFRVTEPNSPVTWASNTSKLVTWEVANTDLAPVSCGQVDILLSIDGGDSYPITLATTANDGEASIIVPDSATTRARLKVACADNIFFGISDTDFTITGTLPDIIFADGFES
ncbi:reprolysin-like metallopeptidase [Nitrosococcus watsonii]